MTAEIENWNSLFQKEDPWSYSSPYELQKYVHTLEMLPPGTPKTALEIGCAEGIFTAMLAGKVEQLTALDISDVALERCRTRCSTFTHINFQQHDISDGLPSGPYDLIVCSEILYYLKDQNVLKEFAGKITQALQDGGHILMTHSNMVTDDRMHTGFDFNEIGALYIGQIFDEITELEFVRELRTELYRVQLFCKSITADRTVFEDEVACPPREVICKDHALFEHPTIKWGGCAVTAAEAKHCLVSRRIPILMYHRVATDGPDALAPYRVSPEAFERQLAYLQRHGYRSLSLDEFYHAWFTQTVSEMPGRPIVLTFDDAYLDFYEIARPLLRKYGFGATVFVPVDFVGGSAEWDSDAGEPARLMDWRHLHELNAMGIDIGAHSCAHVRPWQMTPEEFSRDTRQSKKILESRFGGEVRGYCYPFAAAEMVHREIVKEAGFKYAVGGTGGDPNDRENSFYIPRIEIFGTDSMTDFVAKLPKSELATPDRREAFEELRSRRDRATYMGR